MYLGIDLGTSEVKALVIDENNEIVATHSAPLTIQRPHPHWSEQSPQARWEATEYLMSTLREKCGHHWQAIKAIGLSGQMHGAVLLDEKRRGDSSGDFMERHPQCAGVCGAGRDRTRVASGSETRRCTDLPPPNCYGYGAMSRSTLRAFPPFYCRKTICVSK